MKSTRLFSCAVGMVLAAGYASAGDYQFVSIDVQCPLAATASDCPSGLTPGQVAAQTSAKGINANGDIVGLYVAAGKQHGFLLHDGTFSSIDFPVAGVRATNANGINARGEIVGQYTLPVNFRDAKGNELPEDSPAYCPPNLPSPPNPPNTPDPACTKGFHFWRGQFSTLMFPSTFDATGQEHKHPGAIAMHITSDGDIVGCLHDHNLGPSMFGAVWTRSGTFSLTPNGGEVSASDPMASTGTPMSMNNGAAPGNGRFIAGFYVDMSSQQHGYRVRDGMFKDYDPDGANLTAIWDANPLQQIVGTFRFSGEALPRRHAFLQNPDDSPAVTFDFTCQNSEGCAGALKGTVAFATIAFGINPDGVIVGQYAFVNAGPTHGFIAVPADAN